ncbi:hypothetical protein BDF21DRAFT_410879 [Thamnidium elegans]|uniref:ATPase inhibitor, mitochondrial n=1 Tax=Thamnidium elegans TaxID=101142 RepID=A0A8H7VWM7_9FUNG|nr:hypothetical protein INT48_006590 [Thamnidium elegans]KAI8092066.1 hypothetical protein BDF21DRAFT_410879 [Thamnidium elegans]KAI9256390.1 hypothetical protein EDC94DRAFT_661669 [Helicostylum pulchrum]
MNQAGNTTSGSKAFASREQAAENQYARQKEQEQIKALKASLDAKKQETDKPNQ